ncbi:MAG TPA: hypothetical protein VEN78_28940 [Bradyrhizobium sp.]|nr:hypothetical protein [Bradyrhizobium sp.]
MEPIELIGADDNDGVFPVKRNSLRATPLRFPDHLAEASLRVLKPPSSGPEAGCRPFLGCRHRFDPLVTVTRIIGNVMSNGKERVAKKMRGPVLGKAEDKLPRIANPI